MKVEVATTLGNWGEVCDKFDLRAKAKSSKDVVAVGDDAGESMFARAGVSGGVGCHSAIVYRG